MATLKTCFKCSLEKPRTEFYAHPQMGDGLLGKCKSCTRNDVRANYAAKAPMYRAYDKQRNDNPLRKARTRASFAAAQQKWPERLAAARAAGNAIRDGRLIPQPCWVCGEKAEAHHPDYSRPLDVVWLCRIHHRQAHAITRRVA
jgi:hypothetical protein